MVLCHLIRGHQKGTGKIPSAHENMEQWALSFMAGGSMKGCSHSVKWSASFYSSQIHTHTHTHTHTHPKTQSFLSCVYFQQKWVLQSNMKRMSINQIYEKKLKWQSWQNGHTYNEILLSTEKEQRWAIYNHKKDSHRIMKIRKRYNRINCGVGSICISSRTVKVNLWW